MSVIAVVNRKGGSGKSTLATHVAGYLAARGHEVMLGDVDKQQSSRLWLSLRPAQRASIQGWTVDERNFARPPAGVKHVVLDTPGGFHGLGLMKLALYADAILIPATHSIFDRTAAAECVKELRAFPRIATGKCQLAVVGMRIDNRTRMAAELQAWADELGLPYLSTIKSAQIYSRCMEEGLSLFDFPGDKIANHVDDWKPITRWLDALITAEPAAPKLVRPIESREFVMRAASSGLPEFLRR